MGTDEFAIVKAGDNFLIKLQRDAAASLVSDIAIMMNSEECTPTGPTWLLALQINALWYAENGMNICDEIADYSELEDLYEILDEE